MPPRTKKVIPIAPEDKRVCKHCAHFEWDKKSPTGECRRYPRQVVCGEEADGFYLSFEYPDHNPEEDWCGEFSRRTN